MVGRWNRMSDDCNFLYMCKILRTVLSQSTNVLLTPRRRPWRLATPSEMNFIVMAPGVSLPCEGTRARRLRAEVTLLGHGHTTVVDDMDFDR
jgi:hypothetical protein